MIFPKYRYELWNGKEVVGLWLTNRRLEGDKIVIPYLSTFKQPYGVKPKQVVFKLITRVIDSWPDTIYRISIDVRNKSRKQIDLLLQAGSIF